MPPVPMPERSKLRRVLATVQPLFSPPTTFSFSAFTSVKKVSQNGELPLMSRIGRTSMPGVFMSIEHEVMPLCLVVSSVRTSMKIQFAYWPPLVQVFWPLTM